MGYTPVIKMADSNLEWSPTPATKLNIPATLLSGQCFRWRITSSNHWAGVTGDTVIRLVPAREGFWWQTYPVNGKWDLVSRYFALDVDLDALFQQWIAADPRIAQATRRFSGLRILRQEIDEVIFSFLCASCNTITKITRSIQSLEKRAGEPIAQIEGTLFYKFPRAEAISALTEQGLRADLWGYRAPRLLQIAGEISSLGPGWFDWLRGLNYREAHAALMEFFGIGAKIADCICVFGLGHEEAVPVDTHVRRKAVELYEPDLKGKSLTPGNYAAIAEAVRSRFGGYAGWAQQYLFFDDLKTSLNV